jgi:hypothetical protein
MKQLLPILPCVFCAQGAMEWAFYRSRVVSQAAWAGSDFVVFGVPLLLGCAVAGFILFLSFHIIPTQKRLLVSFGTSVAGAVIASFAGALIAFNLYGT